MHTFSVILFFTQRSGDSRRERLSEPKKHFSSNSDFKDILWKANFYIISMTNGQALDQSSKKYIISMHVGVLLHKILESRALSACFVLFCFVLLL